MLTQANHWLEIAAALVDALLLGRILLLRLQRLYLFITLACLLAVFFDAVDLWLGTNSPEDFRVNLYSRLLFAFVYPLVAWDVFEEVKAPLQKLRRLAMGRLVSGLVIASVFGLLVASVAQPSDSASDPDVLSQLALILWAGSSTACLAFLWTLHRQTRTLVVERPHNTYVWMVFWELSLLGAIASLLAGITITVTQVKAETILDMFFLLYSMVITGWCIVRLRALPSGAPTVPANVV